jgi:hypothetical protein
MRKLSRGSDGRAFLGGSAPHSQPLARIRATGSRLAISRSVIWGIARQLGQDPTRWQLDGARLVTWGGESFNTLLAALLLRATPGRRLAVTAVGVGGLLPPATISVGSVRELAAQSEQSNDLPLALAQKFTSPSRFMSELSSHLAAEEKRRSIPWISFYRWLDRITGINIVGSMPIGPTAE